MQIITDELRDAVIQLHEDLAYIIRTNDLYAFNKLTIADNVAYDLELAGVAHIVATHLWSDDLKLLKTFLEIAVIYRSISIILLG